METFVSDLLETADLRVITKKDVRVKYKNFIGRNISADEKARINDLVYAFVYYYAAKQKKISEGKPGSGGSSPGDKENKRKHVKEKGTRDGHKVSTNKSPLLTGSDKHNQKRAPRKNGPAKKEYKDKRHYHIPDQTRRKVYPERTGKESRRMKITEVVSAIMDTTNSDSSWSTDSDSDVSNTDDESEIELNEEEREQLKRDVKKLQQAREVRIKQAKDRKQKKKSALAKIDINGQDICPSPKVRTIAKENRDNSSNYNSDDDSLLLLSDTDSDDLPLTVIRNKSSKQENDSRTKLTLKNKMEGQKQIKTEPFSQIQSSEKIKKKKDKPKANLDTSQSGDSGTFELNKTPGSYVKTQKFIKNSLKKEKVTDKQSELKRNIVIESDTESEGNRPIKKKPKMHVVNRGSDSKDQMKSTHSTEKNTKCSNISKGIKVKKKVEGDNVKKIAIHSGIIVKKKKVIDKKARYFKVLKDKKGKKVLDSLDIKKLVKKKREEATLKRVKEKYKEKSKQNKQSDNDSRNTNEFKKVNSSKTLSSEEIKELVKKKREAAALKKTNKEKIHRTGERKHEVTEITSESHNGDISDTNSEISDRLNAAKSKQNKSPTLVIHDTDISDINSSISENSKENISKDSDQDSLDSELTESTLTDSPIKATLSQVKKKKMKQKELESDAESLQNGPSSKKSKVDIQTDKISDSCDKLNKNGLCVVSEDSSSEEDIPLSHIKARLACQNTPSEPAESPHLIELRQICAASGIDIVDDRDLKRCFTNGAKIKVLRYILKEAGMKGLPNLKKAEELKIKREEAAKDTSHILLTETGRARRKVKSIYARLMKPKSNVDTSETSDNDASCLSETDGNEKTDKSILDDGVDKSDSESSTPKEMNLFEILKGLGDSESSD